MARKELQDIMVEVSTQLGLREGLNIGPGVPKKSQNGPKMGPRFDPGLLAQERPKMAKLTKI